MRPTFHVLSQILARQHFANDERLDNSAVNASKAARDTNP